MARQVPQDKREFVRVSVDLPSHEKILNTPDPPLAGWLYTTSLCMAGEKLTDGFIVPRAAIRKAGVPEEVAKWLIEEVLWHEPGHGCPRCPQPPEGKIRVHDYLLHNRSKAQAEAAKRAGRQAAEARWKGSDADRMRSASDSDTDPDHDGDDDPPDGTVPDADRMPTASKSHAGRNAEARGKRQEVRTKPLLTLVGRLAGSDARTSDGQPAPEVVAAWQRIAGPDTDLEAEAASYLAKQGGRPARDEAAAWVGWLRQAARYAAKACGVPAIGCDQCLTGWLPDENGYASPTPCPTCKPHTTEGAS